MNTATLITLLVNVAIPALVAVVTRASLSAKQREMILLALSTASGVISGLVTNPPVGLSQWEHVLLNVVVAIIAAEAADFAGVKTGTTNAVHRVTDRHFGLGTYDPNLQLPQAA